MFLRSSSKKLQRLVWFDLETTGFNIFHNEIIEIAAKDNYGNQFETLISTSKPIPPKITQITSINNDMLQNKPILKNALNEFIKFIDGTHPSLNIPDKHPTKTDYLIGHNALSFDYPFMLSQCKKSKLKFPNVKVIDTMRMSFNIIPDAPSHSLKYLCEFFQINNENAHRAMNDVNATKLLYSNLELLYKSKYNDPCPYLLHQLTTVL
jgi:DNA polymerase-3 subunit alpha (Gram-positive type)